MYCQAISLCVKTIRCTYTNSPSYGITQRCNFIGPMLYMQSVTEQNAIMQHMTVHAVAKLYRSNKKHQDTDAKLDICRVNITDLII